MNPEDGEAYREHSHNECCDDKACNQKYGIDNASISGPIGPSKSTFEPVQDIRVHVHQRSHLRPTLMLPNALFDA